VAGGRWVVKEYGVRSGGWWLVTGSQ